MRVRLDALTCACSIERASRGRSATSVASSSLSEPAQALRGLANGSRLYALPIQGLKAGLIEINFAADFQQIRRLCWRRKVSESCVYSR